MKKVNFLIRVLSVFIIILYITSACTTEDILPGIELSVDNSDLSEANGTVTLTATLNTAASSNIIIPIITSGTATVASDYSLSSSEITINEGQTSGSVLINAIQDQEIEGLETLTFSIGNATGFLVLSGSVIEIAILDDDSDSDNDGVLDSNDNCPNLFGEMANNGCPFLGLIINEVLYDPQSGLAGDANGDGTRSALADEFIEFFNSGPEIDISGYTISDSDQVRHTFPAGSVIPLNGVLVLFGGGTPMGNFGGAIVQTATSGQLNMSNSGDLVTLSDANGVTVLTFDVEPLSNNPNESYTRTPDLTGEFEQHAGITEANGALFSPGTKIDGSSF